MSLAPGALQGRRRILVLGCGGAGKSTLARQLGEKLALPVVHLDIHYWSFGWKPTPDAEWQERVRQLIAGDRWVMDGNFSSSLAVRLSRCDAVVFLDFPRWLCILRVLQRWWRYRFTSRPDLPEGCPEKVDFEFLGWIWNFQRRSRPKVLDAIGRARPTTEVLHMTRRAQTRALLDALRQHPPAAARSHGSDPEP